LAGGSAYNGYLLLVGLLFFADAWAWLRIGVRRDRPILGAALGVVWFFLPYHLHMLFVTGNAAWCMGLPLLPLLLNRIEEFMQTRSWKRLPQIAVGILVLTLLHPGLAAMTALGILVYLIVRAIVVRAADGTGTMILTLLAGLLLGGLWWAPYLFSGVLRQDTSEAMLASFQSLLQSLNPVSYWTSGGEAIYFGLSILLAALAAILFAPRASSGWASAILLLLTGSVACMVLGILLGSQMLRMFWLFPLAAAAAFLALLLWRTARRPVVLLLCALLMLDCVPGLQLLTGSGQVSSTAEERAEATMSAALLDEAQSITKHRLAVLDEGNLGSEGLYLATAYGEPVDVIDGDDRDRAATGDRLRQISRALTGGNYLYLFDRCLELGCDTILLQTGLLPQADLESGLPSAAAEQVGYALVDDVGAYLLYHADLGDAWGVVSQYPAIGIGTTAYYTSLSYPAMEETDDTNLNHYTFEQLSGYELVLLSGFTYDDRDAAEKLVLALSEAGVRVVIEADGVPESRITHDRSFLGVICSDIEFENGYPEMDTIDGILNTDLFPQGYTEWETVFTEGLDDVWGVVFDNDVELPFYGTVKNENIVFVGLNLTYHYALTNDPTVGALLSHAMALPTDRLPERTIVPVTLEQTAQGLTLTTEYDHVNTTLAWHDFFRTTDSVERRNGLLCIDAGTTVIDFAYPDFWQGLAATALGLLLIILLTVNSKRYDRSPQTENAEESELPTE
jgi:uncharacterized membrane protein